MHIKFALIFFATLVCQATDSPYPTIVKIAHSESEWRSLLGTERFCVMRRKATERAYSGVYLYWTTEGIYHCAACNLELFHSSSKYDAHTGWPSFHEPIIQRHVWIKEDWSLPFRRYEVLCRGCDSHLGHVFRQKDQQLRYTINSISIDFHETR
jgi:peptide-methionine (R)-S-oxide reductase